MLNKTKPEVNISAVFLQLRWNVNETLQSRHRGSIYLIGVVQLPIA